MIRSPVIAQVVFSFLNAGSRVCGFPKTCRSAAASRLPVY